MTTTENSSPLMWKVVTRALAGSELDAAKRLQERQADAVNIWLLRVGYRAIATFGGSSLRSGR